MPVYQDRGDAARQAVRDKLGITEEDSRYGTLCANVADALEALFENITAFDRPITIPAMAENEPWLILFSRSSGWQFEWVEMPGVTEEGWYLATLTPPAMESSNGEDQDAA